MHFYELTVIPSKNITPTQKRHVDHRAKVLGTRFADSGARGAARTLSEMAGVDRVVITMVHETHVDTYVKGALRV